MFEQVEKNFKELKAKREKVEAHKASIITEMSELD